MLRQIARDHGNELATRVADQMIHTSIRSGTTTSACRSPAASAPPPRLAQVARMEAQYRGTRLGPPALASEAGMSPRQRAAVRALIWALAQALLHGNPAGARARNLLMQTEMSVIEIALASSFASAAHFSKCYPRHLWQHPYRHRGAARVAG